MLLLPGYCHPPQTFFEVPGQKSKKACLSLYVQFIGHKKDITQGGGPPPNENRENSIFINQNGSKSLFIYVYNNES